MESFSEEFYLHREHIWARRENERLYRIGVDELFMRDLGGITEVDLPTEGDEVSQDDACGILRFHETKKMLFAPLSGEIIEVNPFLYEDLNILVEDPCGIGWILLLDPSDPEEELENLLHGEEARDWWEREIGWRQNPP